MKITPVSTVPPDAVFELARALVRAAVAREAKAAAEARKAKS